jgi:hypothetical protein
MPIATHPFIGHDLLNWPMHGDWHGLAKTAAPPPTSLNAGTAGRWQRRCQSWALALALAVAVAVALLVAVAVAVVVVVAAVARVVVVAMGVL